MKIFESLDIKEKFPCPVITIGNYDGIHRGHKEIIERVVRKARQEAGTAMLMTFNPHPLSVLKPDTYTRLITPLHLKKTLIEEAGIDVMIIVPFDEAFRQVTSHEYIENILVGTLGVRHIIVGHDFKFGKSASGDTALLQKASSQYGFDVEVVEPVMIDGERIGSNQIRKLVISGEMEKAAAFLERSYMIEGVVVHGEERGRGMGFPTINIDTFAELIPKNGVYVTEVEVDGECLPAVTNIGYNPTFDGKKLLVETHILNFSGDLYDREVCIWFHERVREEVKFSGIEALKERIMQDVAKAEDFFKNRNRKA